MDSFELVLPVIAPAPGTSAGQSASATDVSDQVAQVPSEPVGTVQRASGRVVALRADGTEVALQEGDPVFQGDELRTDGDGTVGVRLIDGTTISLSANGRLVLDELVYDPAAGIGSQSMSLTQGVFSFVSGNIAKTDPDASVVTTPVGTIGIRGTSGVISLTTLSPDGDVRLEVILLPDDTGEIGEIVIISAARDVIQVINQSNVAVRIDAAADGRVVSASDPFRVSDDYVQQTYGDAVDYARPGDQDTDGGEGEGTGTDPEDGTEDTAEDNGDGAAGAEGSDGPGTDPEGPAEETGDEDGEPGPAEEEVDAPGPEGPADTVGEEQQGGLDGGEDADQDGNGAQAIVFERDDTVIVSVEVATALTEDVLATQTAAEGAAPETGVDAEGPVFDDDDDEDAVAGGDAGPAEEAAVVVTLGGAIVDLDFSSLTTDLTVVGSAAANIVVGGAGNDRIDGGAGGDTLDGGAGDDVLDGGSGADRLTGGDGDDTVRGGTGADIIVGGSGRGDDFYDGGDGGNDTSIDDWVIYPSASAGVVVDLTAGTATGADIDSDILRNIEHVEGSPGADTIIGSAAANQLIGAGGDDTVSGLGGGDTLRGDDGNDMLRGGTGADSVFGGAGDDILRIVGPEELQVGDLHDGGDGFDVLAVSGAIDLSVGTFVDLERLVGSDADDSLAGVSAARIGVSDIDLGAGRDSLTLAAGGNNVTVRSVETVTGGAGADAVVLAAPASGLSIDLRGGADSVQVAAGTSSIALAGTEAVSAAAGSTALTLTTGQAGTSIDLGDGIDSLTLAGTDNVVTVVGSEDIVGGAGRDVVTLGEAVSGIAVNLVGGADELVLTGGANTLAIRNTETVSEGDAATDLVLTNTQSGTTIDLGGGNDRLALANGTNTVTTRNVETVTGGAGADTVTLGAAAVGLVIDLGDGADTLVVASGTTAVTLASVESLAGTAGVDRVVLTNTQSGLVVDLAGGSDRLTLNGGGNSVVVQNVEDVAAGSGDDSVVVATGGTGLTFDLGAGFDTVGLAVGTFGIALAGVDSVRAGAGDTVVAVATTQSGLTVDLGAGTDTLALADGGNTVVVANVEAVVGGTGADEIVLSGRVADVSLRLGAGTDTVRVATGASQLSLTDVEVVTAGTGSTDLALTNGQAGLIVDLGDGVDGLTLSDGGNDVTVRNVELVGGGTGADVVRLDAPASGISFDLAGGSDTVVVVAGASSLALSNVEVVTGDNGRTDLVLTNSQNGLAIDLGPGADTVALSDGGNTVTVANAVGISAGNGADTVVLAGAAPSIVVDLGGGSDTLGVAGGVTGAALSNVERVTGLGGDTTLVLTNSHNGLVVDLGAGTDTLVLADGVNSVEVAGVERVTGGAGNDVVVVAALGGSVAVDLSGGTDIVGVGDGSIILALSNVDSVIGSNGANTVTLANAHTGLTIDLGSGVDALTLGSGANVVLVAGVEVLTGGSGRDEVTLTSNSAAISVSRIERLVGSDRADTITVQDAATLATLETGAGADVVTLAAGLAAGSVSLGSRNDTLTVTGAVTGGSIDAGTGNDTVILASAMRGGSVDLGFGADLFEVATGGSITGGTVDLGGNTDTLRISATRATTIGIDFVGLEVITGGAGDQDVTFTGGTGITGLVFDLGDGVDALTLDFDEPAGGPSALTITTRNIETITFDSGLSDRLIGANGFVDATVDLGEGSTDTVELGAGGTNSFAALVGVEVVIGSDGDDTVSVGMLAPSEASGSEPGSVESQQEGGTPPRVIVPGGDKALVDLGIGTDSLALGGGDDSVHVVNVEVVDGGAGSDTVEVLSGSEPGAGVAIGFRNVENLTATDGNDTLTALGALSGAEVIDGGDGVDELVLSQQVNTIGDLVDVEILRGSGGNDRVTLDNPGGVDGLTINLGDGADELVLTAGQDIDVTIENVERVVGDLGSNHTVRLSGDGAVEVVDVTTLIAGAGDDTVTFPAALTGTTVDLASGDDTVVLSALTNSLAVVDVETIRGSTAGANDLTLLGVSSNGEGSPSVLVDLGGTGGVLRLSLGLQRVSVRDADSVLGTAGTDTITQVTNTHRSDAVFNLGSGFDTVIVAGETGVELALTNVERVLGSEESSAGDSVTLAGNTSGVLVDLQSGSDSLALRAGVNSVTVVDVELVTGMSGTDTVTIGVANTADLEVVAIETIIGHSGSDVVIAGDGALQSGSSIDLGSGTDTVRLAGTNTIGSIVNTEKVLGSSGDDTLTMESEITGALTIDLGTGTDTIVLGGDAANTTLRNIENITGGSGDDTVSLDGTVRVGQVDLGGGFNTVRIDGDIESTFTNVDVIEGTSGDNTVRFRQLLEDLTIDMGSGDDAVYLFGGSNSVSFLNTEAVFGTSGDDTLTLQAPFGAEQVGAQGQAGADMVVDLQSGTDTVILSSGADPVVLKNVETVIGSADDDQVTLDDTLRGGSVDLGSGPGGDAVIIAGDIEATFTDVETIRGDDSGNTVRFLQTWSGRTFDMRGGTDTVYLHQGVNTVALVDVEMVKGTSGTDSLTVSNTITNNMLVDLKGGSSDTLRLEGGAGNTVRLRGVESVVADTGDDVVTLSGGIGHATISLGTGTDRVVLQDGTYALNLSGVEELFGDTGSSTVTLSERGDLDGLVIDMGGGTDTLNVGGGNLVAAITVLGGLEELVIGSGNQTLTIGGILGDLAVDLGSGADSVTLASSGNAGTYTNVETVTGSSGVDEITVNAEDSPTTVIGVEAVNGGNGDDQIILATGTGTPTHLSGVTVRAGAGFDSLSFANDVSSADVTLERINDLTGTEGADTITLTRAESSLDADLLGGGDTIVLAVGGTFGGAWVNVETVTTSGLANADQTVSLESALAADASVDLGDGDDRLDLAGVNILTVLNVETLGTGSGADMVTLSNVITTGMLIDLSGTGNDTVVLAGTGGNSVTLASNGADTLRDGQAGSSAASVVTLIGGSNGVIVDLHDGTDRIILDGGTYRGAFRNVEEFRGTSSSDTVKFTNADVAPTMDFDLGQGIDCIVFESAGSTVATLTIAGIEEIKGSSGDEQLTLAGSYGTLLVELGSGTTDSVVLSDAATGVRFRDVEDVTGSSGLDEIEIFNSASTVRGVEVITGSANVEAVTIDSSAGPAAVSGIVVDLGKGADTLNFTTAVTSASVMVGGVDTLTGTKGADVVTLTATESNMDYDLASGTDQVVLGVSGTFAGRILNAEQISTGFSADETVTLRLTEALHTGATVDLGGGIGDRLEIAGDNTLTLIGVESLGGRASGDDSITVLNTVSGIDIDLGGSGGSDEVHLASGTNTLTVTGAGLSRLTQGAGNTTVTLRPGLDGGVIDLGEGTDDRVVLSTGGTVRGSFVGVETIIGSGLNDTLGIENSDFDATVDLGLGLDSIDVRAAGSEEEVVAINLVGISRITGSGTDQFIRLTGDVAGLTSIDLGGGADSVAFLTDFTGATLLNVEIVTGTDGIDTLALSDTTAITANDVETVTAGSGDHTLTMAEISGWGGEGLLVVDLGAGNDALIVSDTAMVDVSNVETITGSSGADIITLQTRADGIDIDGGTGVDEVNLADAAVQSGAFTNVETIRSTTGSAVDDTLTLTAALAVGATVDLGSGSSDVLNITGVNAGVTLNGVEILGGTGGDDSIAITNVVNGLQVDLGSGSDLVTLAAGGSATVRNVETVNAGGGQITLAVASTLAIAMASDIVGSVGDDTVSISSTDLGGEVTVDLGDGSDTLVLTDASGLGGSETATVGGLSNVETLTIATAAQVLAEFDDGTIGAGATLTVLFSVGRSANQALLDFSANTGSGLVDVTGDGSDDVFRGGAGDDILRGGGGNDELAGNAGANTLIGGIGSDTFLVAGFLDGAVSTDTIEDTDGAVFSGARLQGLEYNGNDLVLTLSGGSVTTLKDYLSHSGQFTLTESAEPAGRPVTDLVFGHAAIESGVAASTLTGNSDAEIFWAGPNADIVDGQDGDDLIYMTGTDDAAGEQVVGGDGEDILLINGGTVDITQFAAFTSVEHMRYGIQDTTAILTRQQIGSASLQEVTGSDGVNAFDVRTDDDIDLTSLTFRDWAANDEIRVLADARSHVIGTDFAEQIQRGAHTETMVFDGRGGDDTLTGGAGFDRFRFDAEGQSGSPSARFAALGTDTIADFTSGEDEIVFFAPAFQSVEPVEVAELAGDVLGTIGIDLGLPSAGVILVGAADNGDVEIWVTDDMDDARASNSHQVAVVQSTAGLNGIDQQDVTFFGGGHGT